MFSDPNNLWNSIDALAQFAERWVEQIDRCKVPQLWLQLRSIVSFENLGQFGLKWIINSQEFNQYAEALKTGWESSPKNWELMGQSLGQIIRAWTDFAF